MTVGFPIDKATINNTLGSLVVTVRDSLAAAERINEIVWALPEEKLVDLGYSAEDIALLKSSTSDLAALARVATGRQTPNGASNFFFHSGKLAGLN